MTLATSDTLDTPSRVAWHHRDDTGGIERFELQDATDREERARAEHFIAERYQQAFDARVDAFMPRLLTLRLAGDRGARIRGAVGLRSAQSRLFVEQYLEVPIEQALFETTRERIDRASVVEVGHFSGVNPGTMRVLVVTLTARLQHEATSWVVFAGTRSLCNAFQRMGLRPLPLCPARPERLPASERGAWGRYYAHDPWVYAGRVALGARVLLSPTSAEEAAT
jgi:hypothetical protein